MKNPEALSTSYEKIFNLYKKDGYLFYNMLNYVYVDGDIDPALFTEYYTNGRDNPFLISFKHYGSIDYWWVICVINREAIPSPFRGIEPGTKLKIPRDIVVSDILMSINKNV